MRKSILLLISIIALITLTGCEDIMNVLPKFNAGIPNIISGKYVYFDSIESKNNGTFNELYTFDPKEMKFTLELSDSEKRSGKYSYEYKTFSITEVTGTLKLTFEDGEEMEYEFYFEASAQNGPQSLNLGGRVYEYWGN